VDKEVPSQKKTSEGTPRYGRACSFFYGRAPTPKTGGKTYAERRRIFDRTFARSLRPTRQGKGETVLQKRRVFTGGAVTLKRQASGAKNTSGKEENTTHTGIQHFAEPCGEGRGVISKRKRQEKTF